ncbi:synemin [Eublepharis macularius]|uniref:Synemin n=1 Tax=Eublepharis macularius TaxID=481883 RepID=A0AA97KME7_EUBMA|nr:synemin [Eublepharis macularius]
MQRAEWDEQSELRELNCRLRDYVLRVRALEEENGRLARELAALRGEEHRAERLRAREEEVAELRRAVAELRRAGGEAELEREALRRERARLEALGAQVRELRLRRLEPEAGELRRELERLAADCAALEALLERLRAEHRRLREEQRQQQQQQVRHRHPSRLLALPPPPAPSQRELEDSFALVLSWSCEQSLERYEAELRALQELEQRLGAGKEAEQLRLHSERSRRHLEELWRQGQELAALGERLEQERLAQVERHGAQRGEYQMIIEALEEEKRFLTVSIAEYLKDYHELLQVKAGLSLEIATYRTLLEGESSQWILLWEKEHGRKAPQGVRDVLHEYSNRYSAYRQEKGKRAFPAIQNVDTRYKTPIANMSSSAVYSSRTKPSRIQTAAPGKTLRNDALWLEYRPSTAIKKDTTHQRTVTDQRQVRTFIPSSVTSREREFRQRTLPESKKAEAVITAKESTEVQKGTTITNTFENAKPKVMGVSTTSYNLNSSSKETKYERIQEGTDAQVNEQIREVKVMKEEKPFLLPGRDEKERSARKVTEPVPAKTEKKLVGAETKVSFEKKMEVKHGTEEEKYTVKEPNLNYSKKKVNLTEDESPKDGKYVKWEERIRVDTSGKDLPSDIKMDKSSSFLWEKNVTTQSREAAEIPVLSDVHSQDQLFKNNKTEITLQESKPSVGKQKVDATPKLSRNIPERELNQERVSKEGSPTMDTLLTESIAENIVSDILKGFVQKSDSGLPLDTKFTFLEKKVSEDGKAKSEVTVQSTVQEDLSISDEFDLGRFLKKDVKGVGDTKEVLSDAVLEDIISAGLKGREGQGKRTVQVEIVEEPVECAADERTEFPTPFEVEEAEDTLPGMAGHLYYGGEEKATTSAAQDLKRQQPSVIVSHVEEVSEGDDVVDEGKYFVSTPEEHPLIHEKDDSSVYGQIHIEEESTIKYSWQDEFLQGAQKRVNEGMGSPELIYQVMGGEESAFVSKDEPPVEHIAHAESIVIEREIKIPHEFQTSIKSLFSEESKDPKHQLKEALEKLEDNLPESVKQELSALTKEGQAESSSLEVDIKKVEQTKKGGLVTIVAEVSLSETLDLDQFNSGYLGEGLAVERESPTQFSATYDTDEHMKPESESYHDGTRKLEIIEVASTPWTTQAVSSSAKLSSSGGVKSPTSERVVSEGPVFKNLGLDSRSDPSHLQGPFDINRSVRQIIVGPTEIHRTEEVLHEGPFSKTLEFGSGDFEAGGASAGVSRSVQEFTLGPEETQTEEITYRGPVRKTVGGPENPSQAQFSADSKSTKLVMLGSKQIIEETVFEGPASDFSLDDNSWVPSQTKGLEETGRSVRHIRIDPKEVRTQQVVYEGPLSEVVEHSSAGDRISVNESVRHIKVGQKETQAVYEESSTTETEPSHDLDWLLKEGMLDTNSTVRHIKVAPKESMTSEQIIFKGPISKQHLEFSESGQMFSSEGSARHITSGQKDIWSNERVSYQGSVSESSGISSAGEDTLETEGPTEISRSVRHIRLGPVETHAEQIVFQGPIGTVELSPTDGPPENKSLGHIKIGPKETSFTFQMDVTNVAGGGQEAKFLLSNTKDQPEDAAKGSEREAQTEERSEKSAFNRTVQLQRMVDQRSVVSDEKKIALLYLNENEEEEEEDGPWF